MTVWFDRGLPPSTQWTDWVKMRHAAAHFAPSPFPHLVVSELLDPLTFQALSRSIYAQIDSLSLRTDGDERKMAYGPLLVKAAVELFCGSRFETFLQDLVQRPVWRASGSIPQIRLNRGPCSALPIHTDSHAPFGLATFLFVHPLWDEAFGGQLNLYSAEKEAGPLRLQKHVLPMPNTLVGMIFSKDSYHSVSPITQRVDRVAIYQEWEIAS